MAKLYIQDIPTAEDVEVYFRESLGHQNSWYLYTNFLYMKVASELENSLDNLLAPHNLSSGRFTILLMLKGQADGMVPSAISQRVGVTQATVSGLLNSLEKSELIRRESHTRDGRSYVIKITEKGEHLIQDLFPKWVPNIESFFDQISVEERQTLNKILEKLVRNTQVLGR